MSDNISQDVSIEGDKNIVIGKARDVTINPLPPAETRIRHDLGILLKNVENTWIQGVLEKSVHEAAMLELGLELRDEAVDNPWQMVMEKPDQSREEIRKGRKIKDIFNEANRLLLILGEPGSGKTTTLLQLARDLIADVDEAFTEPVPVILNLSTWTNRQQPLDEWLIVELNSKYRLPKKDGRRWLEERRVLPLLDGLDEVKAENRAACVEKINRLVSDYGLPGLVVCSRIKDYSDLNVRLAFYRAIYIQPLTPEQIDEYFKRAGEKLASLCATLESDEALRGLAQSPLILNIMTLAYQNASAEDLSNPTLDTNEARHKHLFDTYITRMFQRKAGTRQYDDERTRERLSWLAKNMHRHNQDVFLIEGLQPSWLLSRRWQWSYFVASRLVSGMVLFPWLILASNYLLVRLPVRWSFAAQTIIALLTGASIGFIDILWHELFHKQARLSKFWTFWWSAIRFVVITLIGLWFYMPFYGEWKSALIIGIAIGFIFGLRGSRQSSIIDIIPVEVLYWSWRKAFKGGLVGSLAGLAFGFIYGPHFLLRDRFSIQLYFGMIYGLAIGTIGALFNGLHPGITETRSTPNQGIRLSVRNAIFGGLIFVLFLELISFVLSFPNWELGLSDLLTKLSFGLVGTFWYGGLDVIQHYILRLFLVIQHRTPANYARFLDYAADRMFLQKVGGGYRFIHRLLLEHFAAMAESVKAVPSQGSN